MMGWSWITRLGPLLLQASLQEEALKVNVETRGCHHRSTGGVMSFEDGECCHKLLKAGKGKEWIVSLTLQKEPTLLDTLIFALQDSFWKCLCGAQLSDQLLLSPHVLTGS